MNLKVFFFCSSFFLNHPSCSSLSTSNISDCGLNLVLHLCMTVYKIIIWSITAIHVNDHKEAALNCNSWLSTLQVLLCMWVTLSRFLPSFLYFWTNIITLVFIWSLGAHSSRWIRSLEGDHSPPSGAAGLRVMRRCWTVEVNLQSHWVNDTHERTVQNRCCSFNETIIGSQWEGWTQDSRATSRVRTGTRLLNARWITARQLQQMEGSVYFCVICVDYSVLLSV